MERIETTAIRNLIHNEEYCRKVLPFIKAEYFTDRLERLLFSEINKFVNKYNTLPTKESLSIEINTNKNINEDEIENANDFSLPKRKFAREDLPEPEGAEKTINFPPLIIKHLKVAL